MQRWQRRASPASKSELRARSAGRPPNARGRRLAAWVVTGPGGHLYGGAADLTALLARYAVARAPGRGPAGAGSVVSRLAGDDEVERAVVRGAGAVERPHGHGVGVGRRSRDL